MNEVIVDIIQDKDQHVLLRVAHDVDPVFFLSVVYAKCTEELRKELWADFKNIASTISDPWGAIGDFNVICSRDEKIGGRPHKDGGESRIHRMSKCLWIAGCRLLCNQINLVQ